MKRILLLIISASIAIAATGYAYAHPGRTDSQGGHTDRTTGEYHFHHGYPAHQHEDRDGDGVKEYAPMISVTIPGQVLGHRLRSQKHKWSLPHLSRKLP